RRRHTRWPRDWSSDVCSSDLTGPAGSDPLFLLYKVSVSGGVSVFQIPPFNNATVTVTACDAAFGAQTCSGTQLAKVVASTPDPRSEERRVGKECRSRWSSEGS